MLIYLLAFVGGVLTILSPCIPHFGEGEYDESERVIQQLLKENGSTSLSAGTINVSATGVEAAPGGDNVRSPETYIGYQRAENVASTDLIARRFAQGLYPSYPPVPEPVGSRRKLEGESGECGASGSFWQGRVPVSRSRSASGARPCEGWQASPLQSHSGRNSSRRRSRQRRRCEWRRDS